MVNISLIRLTGPLGASGERVPCGKFHATVSQRFRTFQIHCRNSLQKSNSAVLKANTFALNGLSRSLPDYLVTFNLLDRKLSICQIKVDKPFGSI